MIDFSIYLQTSFSFNGSLLDIDQTIAYAKKNGFSTLGLTDRFRTHGLIKFYKSCMNHKVKPLLGLEVVVKSEKYSDLICLLYAKNNQGYQNLLKISSHIANQHNYLELHEINQYKEGLILVAVIDRGGFYQLIHNQEEALLMDLLVDFERSIDHYYLGFGSDIFEDYPIYHQLNKDWNLVIVNPVQYLQHDDAKASEVLKKILRNDYETTGIFEEIGRPYHLQTVDELNQIYVRYPDAIKNTRKMIDSCQVTLKFNEQFIPSFPETDMSSIDRLKLLTEKGLRRRLNQKGICLDESKPYDERLQYELDIIEKMHFEDYFLIVWDFVLYAKKNDILVGPGRGSAAGSLIAYCLGITEVDPIQFDLYFERFLNPERITMPDIDMDFPDDKRDQVIQYVVEKYGKDKVASIVTFGTFQGKSALRDVGRVLEVNQVVIDDLSKKISQSNNSIDQFEVDYPKDYQYYMNHSKINELITIAKKLTGLVRHTSTHAAGIIISNQPMMNYSATQPGLLNMYQTQYEASDLEALGLLKIDFLGIRNLTIIANVTDMIYKDKGHLINVYKLPLDDDQTFKLLKNVQTLGIFQLESEGMMNLMRQMKLNSFEDIATCISLHRPGPMENIPTFIRRRNKEESVEYVDQTLIPILKSTYGIIVYQEQIMRIANIYAGYSLGEADVLRRAVSKKSMMILEKERKKFVEHVVKQGHSLVKGEKIYDYIVKFANYGFNKSHAVAYSYIAYWMAYLKANYPSYFLSVLLNDQIGSISGTKKYIREAQQLGIKVLPPKINHSSVKYLYEEDGLRYPYMAIKGIGEVMAQKIVEIQTEKTVESFIDFYSRARHLPRNVIEALIHANVFSSFSVNKRTLIENLERIEALMQFNYHDESFHYVDYDEFDLQLMEEKERELFGINFEYHLMHRYRRLIQDENLIVLSDAIETSSSYVRFVAALSKVKVIKTKSNQEMAFITLEDEFEQIDGVMFPNKYEQYAHQLVNQKVYLIEGKKEQRNHRLQVIVEKINELKE